MSHLPYHRHAARKQGSLFQDNPFINRKAAFRFPLRPKPEAKSPLPSAEPGLFRESAKSRGARRNPPGAPCALFAKMAQPPCFQRTITVLPVCFALLAQGPAVRPAVKHKASRTAPVSTLGACCARNKRTRRIPRMRPASSASLPPTARTHAARGLARARTARTAACRRSNSDHVAGNRPPGFPAHKKSPRKRCLTCF